MRFTSRALSKVWADLRHAGGRAALVILAMAFGLFGVVSVAVTNAILSRELTRSFAGISPASATLVTVPADAAALERAARVPGVAAVMAGRQLSGRADVDGAMRSVLLLTVTDFAGMRIDRLRSETGAWPPPPNAMLIERAAVRVAKRAVGDTLRVHLAKRGAFPLVLAGTVHDFSKAPAWQEGIIYGYVDRATMTRLVGDSSLTFVRILVAEHADDIGHVRDVTGRVAESLEAAGIRVRDVTVPKPGEHPHQSQMDALLGIQQAFGAVALLLSAALVVVLLGALLAQQRRQIGAMKAIGATPAAIGRLYTAWVLALALGAELLAIPLGIVAGRAYARYMADFLNFDIASDAVPMRVLLAVIALGGVLPLAVALLPIRQAARVSVRDALLDEPMVPASRGAPRLRSADARMAALGLASAVRVRGRFALVVGTLATGGALFLAAINLGRSFDGTLAVSVERLGYDLTLAVDPAASRDSVVRILTALPAVATVDVVTSTRATNADPRDRDPDSFILEGAPFVRPPRLDSVSGAWLAPGTRGVVANHVWMRKHPTVRLGDSVDLRVSGLRSRWRLVGVTREVMAPATLYAPQRLVDSLVEGRSHGTQIHVTARRHDGATVHALGAAIERSLAAAHIEVYGLANVADAQQHRNDHISMIVAFLVSIAMLSLIVGGFGLATMLSVSILERSRELGTLRAIGASRGHLLALVVAEGAWTAAAGAIGALVLSLPFTWALCTAFGRMMLGTSLDVHLSKSAFPALVVVAGVIAVAASALPAWRASLLTPRALLTDA